MAEKARFAMKKGELCEWAQNLVHQPTISPEDSANFVEAAKNAPLKRLAQGMVGVRPAPNPEWTAYSAIPCVFFATFEDGHTETISYKRVVQTRPSYIKRKLREAVNEAVQEHRMSGFEIHHKISFERIVMRYMNKLISSGRIKNLDDMVDICHRRDLRDWQEFHAAYFEPELVTLEEHAKRTAAEADYTKRSRRQWKEWDKE